MDGNSEGPIGEPGSGLFLYRALTLVMLTLMVAVGSGLIVVWQRRQISESALRSAEYELQLAALDRRIQELDAQTASKHQPEYLKRLNEKHGLGLAWPVEEQVFYILPAEEQTLPFWSREQTESNSFDIALMESIKGERFQE